ncbi:molybdopterin synthase subunit MoaD [Pseudoxanthomonas sp. 3HH-4]|uniref:MoaD/ThiS family protein n=1 Tax=Pseudoxanthomonas sp. 3HH-4 TaxID=1690214 RepID=UPI00114E150A|nr:MoaD/ThiS family protein [Pseudoxanthomonas sp. 3HH-4]TQM12311.1 molybdopterin synthase subunit MoaD [Pseudoxanthomonas sp. 3HH-4]
MKTVRVLYFASLRDAVGLAEEDVSTEALDLAGLYAQVAQRHGLQWPTAHLRVASDGAFARWSDAPQEGSEIAFIPPVSGG